MWLKTVDSLDHRIGLWCKPQSHASFAGTKAGATRLWMRPLVCRCYIQWLCNVCAACGTYVVNWMYFIISEQIVIILYIEVIHEVIVIVISEQMYFAVNLYSDDVIVDVITIRGNRNFHVRLFVKVRVVTVDHA
jgi:hypothetical protein